MSTTVINVFLLISLLVMWTPGFVVSAMRNKGKEEKLSTPANVKTASTDRIHMIWMFIYILWTAIIVLFIYNPKTINWFWKISFLYTDLIKIIAIIITCVAYYLPMTISIYNLSRSLNDADSIKEGKTALITNGIYRYTRNPMYLSLIIGVFAAFLMIPSLFSLLIAVGMTAVFYAICFDEEKRLMKVFGEEYNKYKNDVGLIFPKFTDIILKRNGYHA